MANLVIDIGNSQTKYAVFNGTKLLEAGKLEQSGLVQINSLIENYEITHSIISSVGVDIGNLEELLKEKTKYLRFSTEVKTGIINKYKSPKTLGLDRLAGVIAAKKLYPNQNC